MDGKSIGGESLIGLDAEIIYKFLCSMTAICLEMPCYKKAIGLRSVPKSKDEL